MTTTDKRYMQRAITLARRGRGRTAPNPAVGCVLVRDNLVVGEGWHRRAGTPHAEVHALAAAGDHARGATAYVTLEPCSHTGKTPPCCDALIAAQVDRVVIGMIDPNPLVSGRGVAALRAAGITVLCGVLEDACRGLNPGFSKRITTGLPYLVYKAALTLDGYIATTTNDSRWVSSEPSRRAVHRLRNQLDAVMVGVDTVIHDDPQLTVRLVRGRTPWRIVVDSRLRTPLTAQLLTDHAVAKTIVVTTVTEPRLIEPYRLTGATVLSVDADPQGRVQPEALLRALAAFGINDILCEGGATLAGALLTAGLVDRCLLVFAPKMIFGGLPMIVHPPIATMAQAWIGSYESVTRVGDDLFVDVIPLRGTPCSQD